MRRGITLNSTGMVVEVELFEKMIPLKEAQPQTEINKLLETFTKVEELIDPRRIKIEITPLEDALKTIVSELTERQELYLRILFSSNDWMLNSEIRKEFEKRGYTEMAPQSIAGIRSGLSRKAYNLSIENLDEREWDSEKGENYYRVREAYKPRLIELLAN